MLCYRLIHYTDHIPDIDTGLRNGDKELGGPLLRIFYGTKAFGDIKYALEKFLAQRKDKKQKTIESALQPLIVELLAKNNTLELSLEQIWNALPCCISGRLYRIWRGINRKTNNYPLSSKREDLNFMVKHSAKFVNTINR